jgi:hypothetical protein
MANKDFIVKNGVQVLGSGSAPSTSTQTGALVVQGGVGIANDVWVGGTLYANGSKVLTTSTLGSSGVISITAGTDTAVTNTLGAYLIWNTSTLASITGRGASTPNAINITNATSATSSSTGALTVTGGVGIQGTLYVGGTTYINGDLWVDGSQTIFNTTQIQTADKTLVLSSSTTLAGTAAGSGIIIGSTSSPFVSMLFDGSQTWNVKGNMVPTSNFVLGTLANPWNTVYGNQLYDNSNRVVTNVTPYAGSGIGIVGLISGGPSPIFTITNMGVVSLSAGSGISVSASTGSVTVSSTDTLQSVTGRGAITPYAINITDASSTAFQVTGTITAGALFVNGAAAWTTATLTNVNQLNNDAGYLTSSTLGNFGVSAINAGAGIWINASTGSVVVTNTGVLSVFAGTDTAVSSTSGNITIWDISTLQSVTNRGFTTTNLINITNTATGGSTLTNSVTGALQVAGGISTNESLWVNSYGVVGNPTNSGYGTLQVGGNSLATGTSVAYQVSLQGRNNLVASSFSPFINCTTATTSSAGTIFSSVGLRQITGLSGSNVAFFQQSIAYGTKYALSIYVKYSSLVNSFQIAADISAGSSYANVVVDGISLQVRSDLGTNPEAYITRVGGGLYRLTGIITSGASGAAKNAYVYALGTFVGTEVLVASHVQLEYGAGASAYTQTIGSAVATPNNLFVPTGQVIVNPGTSSLPGYSFTGVSPAASGLYLNGGITWTLGGTPSGTLDASGVQILSTSSFSWASSAINGASDTYIWRDGPGILSVRNGNSAQTLRIYNTFTDGLNYERGFVQWAGNRFYIGNENAGTGAARGITFNTPADLLFQTNNTIGNGWQIVTSGSLIPSTTNAFDLGSTANVVRTGYFGTTASTGTTTGALQVQGGAGIGGSVFIGGNLTVGGAVNIYGSINTATNLAGGNAGQIVYQTAPGLSGFVTTGTNGQILISQGTSGPTFLSTSSVYVGNAVTANNIAGGTAGQIPYQSAANTTAFFGPGTAGQVHVSGGTGAPVYQSTLTLAGTTLATSTTTGALVVAGGVGVGGALYVGAGIASTATNNGSLVVIGGVGISGALNAATKSFIIPHPTKPGQNLRHGSLEGPEFGVYIRGRLNNGNTIQLPEYWSKLVDLDTITVDITPVGKYQKLFVKTISSTEIVIGNDALLSNAVDCFYTVYAERADVDKLQVEG